MIALCIRSVFWARLMVEVAYMRKWERTVFIKTKSKCGVCGEYHAIGLTLGSGFVCNTCEANIVASDVDEDTYQVYLDSIKKIWNF